MRHSDPEPTLNDDAARAGWLYYVGGMTQDQIATELGVSRQRAQRLVSRSMADGLIHVRLDHKIGACLHLEGELTRRFGLGHCRVAPSLGIGADPSRAIAGPAAALLETFLARAEPMILALGTGRALRAMVEELTLQDCARHKVVSLIGNIAPDGSASFFDVVMRIADKISAPHYPMPVPVISETLDERAAFHALRPVQAVVRLAQTADVSFVGIGNMGNDAPLLKDGFVTRREMDELQAKGAIGELVGGVFDGAGRYIDNDITARMGGIRSTADHDSPVIAVAAGVNKVPAIRAALIGRLINGLITDELTATAILG